MKIEQRGRSAAARQAGGIDAIGAAFGYADEGGGGWGFERPVETRRERETFARLVNVLRVVKWQRANPERKRANGLRYALKPEVKARANARAREARRERMRTAPKIYTCATCAVEWYRVPWLPKRGLAPKYCSVRCERARYAVKAEDRREQVATGVCGARGCGATCPPSKHKPRVFCSPRCRSREMNRRLRERRAAKPSP